jgi:low temperature requirement protein LtrA
MFGANDKLVKATITISLLWHSVSPKGTHIMDRMLLLSLIILGEGIIIITKAISKIVNDDYAFNAALIGQSIAAALILYKSSATLFYMLVK